MVIKVSQIYPWYSFRGGGGWKPRCFSTYVAKTFWYCSTSRMMWYPEPRLIIDCSPSIFLYYSFDFRPIQSERPSGVSNICQICHTTSKLSMPFIYLLKGHPHVHPYCLVILRWTSPGLSPSLLKETNKLCSAPLSCTLPMRRPFLIWSAEVIFPIWPRNIRRHTSIEGWYSILLPQLSTT